VVDTVDPGKPGFYDAAGDAEYYLGSPRAGIGNYEVEGKRLRIVALGNIVKKVRVRGRGDWKEM
jgi:hypothetical protein